MNSLRRGSASSLHSPSQPSADSPLGEGGMTGAVWRQKYMLAPQDGIIEEFEREETSSDLATLGHLPQRQLRKTLYLRTLAIQKALFYRVFRSKVCGKAAFFEVPQRGRLLAALSLAFPSGEGGFREKRKRFSRKPPSPPGKAKESAAYRLPSWPPHRGGCQPKADWGSEGSWRVSA